MAETSSGKQVVAVIDIGASAIRMILAEVGPKGEINYLENLQKPVPFGKEVFTSGRLGNAAIREGLSVLKNYKALIDSYGATKIQAIATSAVREAANRDHFIDRVFIRTGIDVEILEAPEENRLELIAVEYALGGQIDLEKKNCLILEVSSGSTEMIILNQGKVELTRTLTLGSLRLPERAVAGKTKASLLQNVLRRNIREVVAYAAREYNFGHVNTFIAVGADMRFVVQQIKESLPERFAVLSRKDFLGFIAKMAKMSPEDIVGQFGISYPQAETLYPSLLIYLNFLQETASEEVIIPMASIRDAILIERAQIISGYKRTDVSKQVVSSARHLGEKYQYHKAHALCVTSLALKLFDALQQEHGMSGRERLLLEVSAILHDIGTFISPAGHHKHSMYLVEASEIFGLRKDEKSIVANVVRYHRRAFPKPTHIPYMTLSKMDRSVVSKLAAILRVADAMDHSHQQKIRQFDLEFTEEAHLAWVSAECGDISLERNSIKDKGNMFLEVFGMPFDLKQRAESA